MISTFYNKSHVFYCSTTVQGEHPRHHSAFWFYRCPLKRWSKRTLFSLSSGPSTTQKMWLRSWFRTLLKNCSLCKWRKPFWQTRSTAPQRQPCCWAPMLSKQSLEISQKKATKVDTLHLRDCFRRGELDQHQSVDNSEVCPKGCIYWNCWKLQKKCNPLKLKTKKYRKNLFLF